MRYRSTFLSFMVALGLGLPALPALSQSVVPHTLELKDSAREQIGLRLLREAFQLAQFDQVPLALARAKLGVQLLPDNSDAWALLGGLHLNSNETRQGIIALENSRRLSPKNASVLFSLGSAYFRTEQFSTARLVLEEGLKISPNNAEALFDLGNTLFQLGEYPSAISRYRKSLKNDATSWPAINNIGLVQYEQGEATEAIESWKQALEIDETASEARLALGVALFRQGDTSNGLKMAQDALTEDQRYAEIDFLVENLWGDRLIDDTKLLFNNPTIQSTLSSFRSEDNVN